jgi:hypothetical protein
MAGIFTGSGNTSQTQSTSGSSQHDYAPWFDALTQQIIGNTQSLSNPATNPYPYYTGQMFAPFNQTQQNAFSGVGNAGSQLSPYFNSATGALNSAAPAATGYFNQAGNSLTPTQAGSPYLNQAATT